MDLADLLLSTRLVSAPANSKGYEGEAYRRGWTRVGNMTECRTDIPHPAHQSLRMIIRIPFMGAAFRPGRSEYGGDLLSFYRAQFDFVK